MVFNILLVIPLIFTSLCCSSVGSNGVKNKLDRIRLLETYRNVIFWKPSYSLKEYHSFEDAKIYVLNVPEYTIEMRLIFSYQGRYLNSHKLCSNNISILLQYGSPAIPHRNKIHSDSWLYSNYTDQHDTSVSLSLPVREKNLSSPLRGKWYVTAFLPFVDKVKKIKEKGLSKSDDKCLSALSFSQELLSPSKPPVILAKGQPWQTTSMRFYSIRYYKYFVASYSKKLSVQISCLSNQGFLKLALSATSLPTFSSPTIATNSTTTTCGINITWPQPQSYYYIEVSGTCNKYELTANHEECRVNTSECGNIVPISILIRKRLGNSWIFYDVLNSTTTFSFKLEPDYVGSILTFVLRPSFKSKLRAKRRMCISRDVLPFSGSESAEFFKRHCNETSDGILRVDVVYPQSGTWYITVTILSHDLSPNPYFAFYAQTETCLSNCNNHGSCVVKSDIGVSYGICMCDYRYSGFACSDHHGLDLLAVYLLTISNIAFIPGIVVACCRKFYPEAIVYLFNMYCSTVYHACDSHGYCIYDYNTLQLSDFFGSVLSVWFTLITMIKLRSKWHRTLNILAVLCLFIGIQLARFGFLIIAIPGGIALMFVLLSFGWKCHKRKKCFPSPKRWLCFLLPAFILASIAVGIYTGLETTANYKYLHSLWHIAIASCIPLLLPTTRKPKFYADYYQVNGDDDFRDSDESLLMNIRNTADNQESHENAEFDGITFPQLVT